MNRQVLDRGKGVDGGDFERFVTLPPHASVRYDSSGRAQGVPMHEAFSTFNLLPAASAAATADPYYLISGTGTEVIARAVKGGINLKSQASTPADGDNALLFPAATGTGGYSIIKPASQPRFQTRVAINTITAVFASFGFNESVTDADPTGTAGDGAMFFAAPVGPGTTEVTVDTALTLAQHGNWILAHKVNGADTFTATTVPIVAGRDYELLIELGSDLKARFYIYGVLVGTGPALTDGDTIGGMIGLELTGTPGGQKDLDVRYLSVSRQIG